MKRREKNLFVCTECQREDCNRCIDINRVIIGAKLICKCQTLGHDGEPINQQILDLDSGAIYGPGVVVTKDGTVTFSRGVKE